jgi:hypothetical protein
MPIEVEDADGTIIEFPDGTPTQDILGVMRRRNQEREARQRAPNPGGLAASARRAIGPTPQRGQSRDIQTEFTQTLASINRGIPFAQDVQNVIRGGVSMAQGGTFQEGVEQQRQENRELQSDFRTRRPYAAAFAEGTGNAVPVIATMGTSAPATVTTQTAARGLPLFTQQTVRGGATGATWGGVYGAGTGDAPNLDNWEDRLDRANEGAALGGAFGAATPAVVNAARPIIEPAWRATMRAGGALGRVAQGIPTPAPNSVGMSGGNLQARPPGGGSLRPPPAEPVQAPGRLATLADRAQMSSDDVASAGERARRLPGGERLVDLFEDAGVRQIRPLVQSPGQTGQSAAQAADARFNDAPDVIVSALRRRLGVGETRQQAMASLDADYQRISADLYNPIWQRPMAPEQALRMRQQTQPLLSTPIMRRAITQADDLFQNDIGLGLVRGSIDDHQGRWLHYVKMGLDDVIRRGRRDGSIEGNLYRQAMEARTQLLRIMDDNLEGYQTARNQWAGRAAAEDALDEGAEFLSMLPEEVAARRAQMSDFELQHARIGFADAVRRAVRGQVVGNRNVANGIMNDPDAQRAMVYLFDDPAQAADFLDLLNTQNRLMRNANQWGTGAQTFGNQEYGADGVVAAVAEAGGHVMGGRFGQAVNVTGRRITNAVTGGMVERSNNRLGRDLLQRVDTQESRAFLDEVVNILRQREAARRAADASVAPAAAATGSQQGRD